MRYLVAKVLSGPQSDVNALQEDLKQLEIWEKAWNMKFNLDKYMVLHITLKGKPLLLSTNYYLNIHLMDIIWTVLMRLIT